MLWKIVSVVTLTVCCGLAFAGQPGLHIGAGGTPGTRPALPHRRADVSPAGAPTARVHSPQFLVHSVEDCTSDVRPAAHVTRLSHRMAPACGRVS